MKDHHDLYLKDCDLDPCHYITAPSVSWDALLNMKGQKVKLITDVTINPYLEGYDKRKPGLHIMYLDMNNLYGSAMPQKAVDWWVQMGRLKGWVVVSL